MTRRSRRRYARSANTAGAPAGGRRPLRRGPRRSAAGAARPPSRPRPCLSPVRDPQRNPRRAARAFGAGADRHRHPLPGAGPPPAGLRGPPRRIPAEPARDDPRRPRDPQPASLPATPGRVGRPRHRRNPPLLRIATPRTANVPSIERRQGGKDRPRRNALRDLAEGPVWIEPVSGSNSLFIRENTGISITSGPHRSSKGRNQTAITAG